MLSLKLERFLNRFGSPRVRVCGRSVCAYQFCGFVGLAAAALLGTFLALIQGLSPGVVLVILLTGASTFFALVIFRKTFTREERITYYHHKIAVMVLAAFLLWVWRQPILPYLDITILGVGVFLACGRVGCFKVGCCHGRPFHWGVCYRQEHADAGFSRHYVGVRLLPIQLLESLWVLWVVAIGSGIVLFSSPAGMALSFYIVTYALGRFCFEFMRGDPNRLYLCGFSEAQWLSVVLVVGVLIVELSGRLPYSEWHTVATVALFFWMVVVMAKRLADKTEGYHLLHPRHINELAEAVERISEVAKEAQSKRKAHGSPIAIARTSLGVQISMGRLESKEACVSHYTLSRKDGLLSPKAAEAVALLLRRLVCYSGPCEIIEAGRGVFHLLINPLSTRRMGVTNE